MDQEELRERIEDLVQELEVAREISDKYDLHEEMSRQGKHLVIGSSFHLCEGK